MHEQTVKIAHLSPKTEASKDVAPEPVLGEATCSKTGPGVVTAATESGAESVMSEVGDDETGTSPGMVRPDEQCTWSLLEARTTLHALQLERRVRRVFFRCTPP